MTSFSANFDTLPSRNNKPSFGLNSHLNTWIWEEKVVAKFEQGVFIWKMLCSIKYGGNFIRKKDSTGRGGGTCDKPGAGKTILYQEVFDYRYYFPPSPPPPPSYLICTKFLRNIETKKETNLLTFVVRWSAVDLCCWCCIFFCYKSVVQLIACC